MLRVQANQILTEMKSLGRVSPEPFLTLTSYRQIENSLGIELPASYREVITTCEPEMANFYFKAPSRHTKHSHLVVFATWGEDQFAFDASNGFRVKTINANQADGKEWANFEEWLAYVWGMSNRPVNPE